jgi:hypothetical protein
VNAIVLVKGTLRDTNYFDQLAYFEKGEQAKNRSRDYYTHDAVEYDDSQDFEEISTEM